MKHPWDGKLITSRDFGVIHSFIGWNRMIVNVTILEAVPFLGILINHNTFSRNQNQNFKHVTLQGEWKPLTNVQILQICHVTIDLPVSVLKVPLAYISHSRMYSLTRLFSEWQVALHHFDRIYTAVYTAPQSRWNHNLFWRITIELTYCIIWLASHDGALKWHQRCAVLRVSYIIC